MKIYAEPQERETQNHSGGVRALSRTSQALIPSKAGIIKIPGARIRWWDVVAKKYSIAEIPEREVSILPTLIKKDQKQPISKVNDNTPLDIQENPKNGFTGINTWWPLSSVLLMLLWLTTLGMWYIQYRISNKQIREMRVFEKRRYTKINFNEFIKFIFSF